MWRDLKRLSVSVCGSMVLCIGPSPRGTFWCKVFGRKGLSLDFSLFAVKCEGPAFWPGLFLSTFILSNWVELKCQIWWIYFWLAGPSFCVVYGFSNVEFEAPGLDTRVWP